MAKRCVECGKEFKGKGQICPNCEDAMRHNLYTEPRIPKVGVPPASVRTVPLDEVQGNIMAHMLCERTEKPEAVNHPLHYGGDTTYECYRVLKNWVSKEEYRGFLHCNAIKYLCRLGKKDEAIQELEKAKWYIEKLIEDLKER